MSPQRYAAVSLTDDSSDVAPRLTSIQVNQHDDNDEDDQYDSPVSPTNNEKVPSSPPPSFRSRASSIASRRLLQSDPLNNDADRELADAFDDDENSDHEEDSNDRERLVRANSVAVPSVQEPSRPGFFGRTAQTLGLRAAPSQANDGVFANIAAKPTAGESSEDKPPTYEQAAADATPPYWETTILAPGMNSDEVYINGLPVGSVFSFIWNGMISMSFLFPGFLLTYLLHTTHAAKNGSLAGLGLTLVQYGFYMRTGKDAANPDAANPGQFSGTVPDPNSHTFDPNNPNGDGGQGGSGSNGFGSSDLISYGLMIIGWFILIRAVSGFLRARREEMLVLQSPARGLSQPVVAEGEGDRAV